MTPSPPDVQNAKREYCYCKCPIKNRFDEGICPICGKKFHPSRSREAFLNDPDIDSEGLRRER
jgi:hypothetical protein